MNSPRSRDVSDGSKVEVGVGMVLVSGRGLSLDSEGPEMGAWVVIASGSSTLPGTYSGSKEVSSLGSGVLASASPASVDLTRLYDPRPPNVAGAAGASPSLSGRRVVTTAPSTAAVVADGEGSESPLGVTVGGRVDCVTESSLRVVSLADGTSAGVRVVSVRDVPARVVVSRVEISGVVVTRVAESGVVTSEAIAAGLVATRVVTSRMVGARVETSRVVAEGVVPVAPSDPKGEAVASSDRGILSVASPPSPTALADGVVMGVVQASPSTPSSASPGGLKVTLASVFAFVSLREPMTRAMTSVRAFDVLSESTSISLSESTDEMVTSSSSAVGVEDSRSRSTKSEKGSRVLVLVPPSAESSEEPWDTRSCKRA